MVNRQSSRKHMAVSKETYDMLAKLKRNWELGKAHGAKIPMSTYLNFLLADLCDGNFLCLHESHYPTKVYNRCMGCSNAIQKL